MKQIPKQFGIDIVFLCDSTNSMDPYIELVREALPDLVKRIANYWENNQEKALVRIGIVSYKDKYPPRNYDEDLKQQLGEQYFKVAEEMYNAPCFEVLPFTNNIQEAIAFLKNIKIMVTLYLKLKGGDDAPEELKGAIEQALKME